MADIAAPVTEIAGRRPARVVHQDVRPGTSLQRQPSPFGGGDVGDDGGRFDLEFGANLAGCFLQGARGPRRDRHLDAIGRQRAGAGPPQAPAGGANDRRLAL
jgi:hypothetical protein